MTLDGLEKLKQLRKEAEEAVQFAAEAEKSLLAAQAASVLAQETSSEATDSAKDAPVTPTAGGQVDPQSDAVESETPAKQKPGLKKKAASAKGKPGPKPKAASEKTVQKWGQNGPAIKLDPEKLNEKEKQVLMVLSGLTTDSAEAKRLNELAAAAFPDVDPDKANSWTRNSMRRLVRGKYAEKLSRGHYRVSKKGIGQVAEKIFAEPMEATA